MNSALKPVWGILVILVAVIGFQAATKFFAPKEIIPWRTDFDAASAEARASGKPLFAYFTAEWCGPCQGLKRTTWADKSVNAALANYVPVKVDVDRYQSLAARYQTTGIPRFIIMDADGTVKKASEPEAMEPERLLAWLKS